MTDAPVYALMTGGGTGGHVTPALAIADALVASGHSRSSIRFVGAARGLEATAVPEAGYVVELLTLDGIQRSFSPRAMMRSARAIVAFVVALARCISMLRRLRPAVVVGVGGYASAPCVLAARVVRIPTVVHEQNAVPGIVNRIAVPLGARPAVSFPMARWPEALVTGNPIRSDVGRVVRAPVQPPVLAIVGGSQGAGRLNDVGLDLYDRWRDRTDVAIRHVTGPKHADACRARLARLRRPTDRLAYEIVGFEHAMAELYALSTVMLCRSGATTIAEVNAVGIAAVYVPWSGAAEGQQVANAQVMVGLGAAEMLTDATCDIAHVEPVLAGLLADRDRVAAMARAARDAGRPDAAARVGAFVEEVAGAAA